MKSSKGRSQARNRCGGPLNSVRAFGLSTLVPSDLDSMGALLEVITGN